MAAHERDGSAMSLWEVVAVFAGIPIAVGLTVAALVYWLAESRVPDGIAAADRRRAAPDGGAAAVAEPGEETG